MAESEEQLKSLLMKVKEGGEKAGLQLNFQTTMIMACSSITLWQIDWETMETESLCFGAPKLLKMVSLAMKLKDAFSLEKKL